MGEPTKGKGLFEGVKILRVPEDIAPIKTIPSDIPPLEWVKIDSPKHWFYGRPKQVKNVKEETK